MKYRRLPVEKELEDICAKEGPKAMDEARVVMVTELVRSKGFGLVVALLRDIEKTAMDGVRGTADFEKSVAIVRSVDFIRRAISTIAVTEEEIDWYDEQKEEFLPDGDYEFE